MGIQMGAKSQTSFQIFSGLVFFSVFYYSNIRPFHLWLVQLLVSNCLGLPLEFISKLILSSSWQIDIRSWTCHSLRPFVCKVQIIYSSVSLVSLNGYSPPPHQGCSASGWREHMAEFKTKDKKLQPMHSIQYNFVI